MTRDRFSSRDNILWTYCLSRIINQLWVLDWSDFFDVGDYFYPYDQEGCYGFYTMTVEMTPDGLDEPNFSYLIQNEKWSNYIASEFTYVSDYLTLRSLLQRLVKNGHFLQATTSISRLFCDLKHFYKMDMAEYLSLAFFWNYRLPFKHYIYKTSNKTYTFPGPLFSDAQEKRLLLRFFSKAIRLHKKHLTALKFSDRFGIEVCAFLSKDTDNCFFFDFMYDYMREGLNGRAFAHYRWRFRKRI